VDLWNFSRQGKVEGHWGVHVEVNERARSIDAIPIEERGLID